MLEVQEVGIVAKWPPEHERAHHIRHRTDEPFGRVYRHHFASFASLSLLRATCVGPLVNQDAQFVQDDRLARHFPHPERLQCAHCEASLLEEKRTTIRNET